MDLALTLPSAGIQLEAPIHANRHWAQHSDPHPHGMAVVEAVIGNQARSGITDVWIIPASPSIIEGHCLHAHILRDGEAELGVDEERLFGSDGIPNIGGGWQEFWANLPV